jgi:hypothetical protein
MEGFEGLFIMLGIAVLTGLGFLVAFAIQKRKHGH